jgi:prepilin-type N-terminal cleavage/methylation domain-containing protein
MILPGMISDKTVKTHVGNISSKLSLLAAMSERYAGTVCVPVWTKYVTCAAPRRLREGFSLSELLFTVGILAILWVIAMPSLSIVMHICYLDSTIFISTEES